MSKYLLLSFLAALSGVLFTLAAQDAVPPPAVPPEALKPTAAPKPSVVPVLPSSDPFIRNHATRQPPKPPTVVEPSQVPANLLATLETWSLSQADFAAILDGPADERAPYDQLEELAKAGKATLVNVLAINTKSGQRGVLELLDELPYVAKATVSPEGIPSPAGWETRNTGDTLEIEMVLGPDGKTIEVNLVPQTVRFDASKMRKPKAPKSRGRRKVFTPTK